MRIIDPGHKYAMKHLDGVGEQIITFVKRKGIKYPGNNNSYPGTNIQEGCRVFIDRLLYLDNQKPSEHNSRCIFYFRQILIELETRAAILHNRIPLIPEIIETEPTCNKCGHIGCNETCKG